MSEDLVESEIEGAISDLSVVEAAQLVPEQYLALISGEQGAAPSPEDRVFLVRRSDIKNLRNYVREVRLLPTDLSEVEEQLGYTLIGIFELEPASIQQFNQRVKQHAGSWDTLEKETKELARQLDTFAHKFVGSGSRILNVIDRIVDDRFVSGTIKDLTEEEIEELSDIAVNESQKESVEIIQGYLREMMDVTASHVKKTADLSRLAAEFERKLTDELIPEVELKVRAYKKSALSDDAEELLIELEDLDQLIEGLAQTYKTQVGYAFTGLVFGPIGLVITGGVFGWQAEDTRATKNDAIARRKEIISKIDETKAILLLLTSVNSSFVDLRGRMLAAEVGAKQLAQVWQHIYKYLEETADGLDGVDNLAKLHRFALEFSLVLAPWGNIRSYVDQISSAFNDEIK